MLDLAVFPVNIITLLAPAKINLALHVTGRRDDGYHLLESLVVFTAFGDRITVEPAETDRFFMSGRYGQHLPDDQSNIVVKARDALRARIGDAAMPVSIHLEKNLPLASGIGGGSSDAAATLRALVRLWDHNIPDDELKAIGLGLGADLPMCLHGRPLIARGIGDELETLKDFPRLPLVLVNNGHEITTPSVFSALQRRNNPSLDPLPDSATPPAITAYLDRARNDLYPPVRDRIAPEISEVMDMLVRTRARFARMSGSGGTCFGIYDNDRTAHEAAGAISTLRPDWFVTATTSLPAGGMPHGWD
ncbi:MAG: 4-(cytidine 5'-diphospho)-2-C-methyl-D-erythritol kinase [Phyllobacterium sp.]